MRLVATRPKRFCYDIARPVDFEEALRFRRAVVWVVFLLLAVVVGVFAYMWRDEFDFVFAEYSGWLVGGVALIYAVLVWLFLYTWTGVHTYWFHPRHLPVEHQNRAVALSYYACAPLMWLPLIVLARWSGLDLIITGNKWMPYDTLINTGGILCIFAFAAVVGLLGMFIGICVTMARHVARRDATGLLLMAVMLPMTWLVLLGFFLIVIPAVVGYLTLMVYTLSW
jgi:hypothetical protein